jgi:hypothetical protein
MAKRLVASQEDLSSMELVCIAASLQVILAARLQWVETRRLLILCLIYIWTNISLYSDELHKTRSYVMAGKVFLSSGRQRRKLAA